MNPTLTPEEALTMPMAGNQVFGAIGPNPFIEFFDRDTPVTMDVMGEAAQNGTILLLNEDDQNVKDVMNHFFVCAVSGKMLLNDAKHRFHYSEAMKIGRSKVFPSLVAFSGKLNERNQIDTTHAWLTNEADAVLFSMEYTTAKEAANNRL